jgi:hypothetical protein
MKQIAIGLLGTQLIAGTSRGLRQNQNCCIPSP